MKQGSKVHRVLEEQVHTIVPIQTETKEDRFGLKIWNTIQGLRTLRATGLTRELEIWGTIDGQLVNGVIDELSYTCPDPQLAESLETARTGKAGQGVESGQRSISEMFASAEGESVDRSRRAQAHGLYRRCQDTRP
jgi:exonuclease V